MFMYFEPLATKMAIATYHVMLFGCQMGGNEGDLLKSMEGVRPLCKCGINGYLKTF